MDILDDETAAAVRLTHEVNTRGRITPKGYARRALGFLGWGRLTHGEAAALCEALASNIALDLGAALHGLS
jgi:hypothetical protein